MGCPKNPASPPYHHCVGPFSLFLLKSGRLAAKAFTLLQMVTTGFHGTLSYSMLTQEDAQTAPEGSHESRVWNVLPMKEGTPLIFVQAGARLENWYVSISRFDRRFNNPSRSLGEFRQAVHFPGANPHS